MRNKYTLAIQMGLLKDIDVDTLYELIEDMLLSYTNKTQNVIDVPQIVVYEDFVDLNK